LHFNEQLTEGGKQTVANAPSRVVEPTFRLLVPGDENALETHLTRHWSTSLLLRAHFRAGGLSDEGELNQGTYAAAFDGATMIGVAAHFRDGSIMLQASRAIGQVVRMAVGESKLMVERIIGAWTQVNAAAAALGNDPSKPFTGRAQALLTLQMGKLQAGALKRDDAKPRLATEADLNTLATWQAAHDAAPGTQPSPDEIAMARPLVEQRIAAQSVFVAEAKTTSGPRIVAMASVEALLTDSAQIGGVFTPGTIRDKAFSTIAVLGAVQAVQKRGAARVALTAEKTSVKALDGYRVLGFVSMDEFGVLTAPM
jgi:hypothetical protein